MFEDVISPIHGSSRKSLLRVNIGSTTNINGQPQTRELVGIQTPDSSNFGPRSGRWSILDSSSTTPANKIPPSPLVDSSVLTDVGSFKSIDDQLERIKFAKERATRTLENVSNLQSSKSKHKYKNRHSHGQDLNETDGGSLHPSLRSSLKSTRADVSSIEETEAFVNDILNSCGKQTLAH